jgi:hypothetical protein
MNHILHTVVQQLADLTGGDIRDVSQEHCFVLVTPERAHMFAILSTDGESLVVFWAEVSHAHTMGDVGAIPNDPLDFQGWPSALRECDQVGQVADGPLKRVGHVLRLIGDADLNLEHG